MNDSTTLAEARAAALAAGVPASLIDEAEKSARNHQDWGSFCWAWQEEIKGLGEVLRAVHGAAAREHCENRGAGWRCAKRATRVVVIEGRPTRLCDTCKTAPTYEEP